MATDVPWTQPRGNDEFQLATPYPLLSRPEDSTLSPDTALVIANDVDSRTRNIWLRAEHYVRALAVQLQGKVINLANAKKINVYFKDLWNGSWGCKFYDNRALYRLHSEIRAGYIRLFPSPAIKSDTRRMKQHGKVKINSPFTSMTLPARDAAYMSPVIKPLISVWLVPGDLKLAWRQTVHQSHQALALIKSGTPSASVCSCSDAEMQLSATHQCASCRREVSCHSMVNTPSGTNVCGRCADYHDFTWPVFRFVRYMFITLIRIDAQPLGIPMKQIVLFRDVACKEVQSAFSETSLVWRTTTGSAHMLRTLYLVAAIS